VTLNAGDFSAGDRRQKGIDFSWALGSWHQYFKLPCIHMTCFPMNSANTFKTTNILLADAGKYELVSCNQQFFFKFF